MTKTVPAATRWLPFLALALFLGQVTPASAANARLRGTVVDGEGDPIEGVQATLVSESGGTRLNAETNARGRFRMLIVDPTHPPYVLQLEKEGFQPLEEVVQLRANDVTSWDAVMAPAETQAPAGPEDDPEGDPEAVALYNEGAAFYNEGLIDEAVNRFEEAIAVDPSLAPAHRIVANLYANQRRYGDALAAAERLLELTPGDPEAALLRYDALQALGRDDEAHRALTELVEIGQPSEVATRIYNQAVQRQKRDREDEALALFRQAVELDPELAPAWAAIAGIELAKNRPQPAIDAAAKLLELRPGDNEAMTIQYEAYQMLGEAEKAEELLAQMEAGGQDPGALYRRGVALFNASNYEQAEPTLRQAVELDPELAGAHFTLGLTLVNRGDQEGAARHLRRFLELDPDHSDAETARQMLDYLDSQ